MPTTFWSILWMILYMHVAPTVIVALVVTGILKFTKKDRVCALCQGPVPSICNNCAQRAAPVRVL
jgi:predicted metal-binding membrane protein